MPKAPQKSTFTSSSQDSAPSPLMATSRPKLVISAGRGGRGKTWWDRWAIERAQSAGRSVIIADADRTNPTLSAFYGEAGVVVPTDAEDAGMRSWFIAFLQDVVARQLTAVLDLGGGDSMLKEVSRETNVVDFLDRYGVQVVAVHLLSPDKNDLAYLRDLEADGLFAPKATLLVMNEALVPSGRSVKDAFRAVMEHEIFQAAVDRGAKPILMPRLWPAPEIDQGRLTFAAAEAGGVKDANGNPTIGIWNQQLITDWLRTMEKNFESVAEWLP